MCLGLPPAMPSVRLLSKVAKGRDTGVSQVTGFTAKISMGNGMQVTVTIVTVTIVTVTDFSKQLVIDPVAVMGVVLLSYR